MKKLLIKLLNQEVNKYTNPTGSITYYEAGNLSLRICSFIVSFIKDNTNFWFYCPAINNKPEEAGTGSLNPEVNPPSVLEIEDKINQEDKDILVFVLNNYQKEDFLELLKEYIGK